MDINNPESTQGGGPSQLSVDAESFVPAQYRSSGQPQTTSAHQPDSSHQGHQWGIQAETPAINAQHLNQLPSYVTSCYPFVQGDPGTKQTRPSGTWQGPGRPPVPPAVSGNQQIINPPLVQQGSVQGGLLGVQRGYAISTTRVTRPNSFPPHQHLVTMNGGLISSAAFQGNSSSNSQLSTPTGGAQVSGFPLFPYQTPMVLGQAHVAGPGSRPEAHWAPSPAGSNTTTSSLGVPSVSFLSDIPPCPPNPRDMFNPSASHFAASADDEKAKQSKSKERKQKKKRETANLLASMANNSRVSIGTQNDAGILSAQASKSKRRSRTLILFDIALQTDFSDEIANMTLAEKPNSLYKRSAWQEQFDGGTTTEEEEEVDSDSGYSSPMHRRNQASTNSAPTTGTGSAYITPLLHTGTVLPLGAGANMANFPPLTQVSAAYNQPFVPGFHHPLHVLPVQDDLGNQVNFRSALTGGKSMKAAKSVPSNAHPVAKNTNSGNSDNAKHMLGQNMNTPSSGQVKTDPEDTEGSAARRRRRRSRRRKRKGLDSDDAVSAFSDDPSTPRKWRSSSCLSQNSSERDDSLRFADEEFPDLKCATVAREGTSVSSRTPVFSYSDILRSQPSSKLSVNKHGSLNGTEGDSSVNSTPGVKLGKNARKRLKRREAANRAAEEELAEITFEQQVLKDMANHKQQQQAATGSGKKSRQPLCLSIADMIDQSREQKQLKESKQLGTPKSKSTPLQKEMAVGNILDSTAPTARRGKERETPKVKKPSPLKKVILKEREEKKRLRLLDEPESEELISPPSSPPPDSTSSAGEHTTLPGAVPCLPLDSDFSQDGMSSKTSSMDPDAGTPLTADMSPISQTSPISMSPLSPGGSPNSSGLTSPIISMLMERKPQVLMKIHSRRFREYCTQVLDKEIDDCCMELLQDLVKFQDRMYQKDPTKAKSKRRFVLGLREVTKHLKLGKIKGVIISPNLERIQSKGGLDEALNNIIQMCNSQELPFIFALGRRALGRACAKLVPVSVVGIFNYEGSDENFHRLISLTEKARSSYREMVSVMEQEVLEHHRNHFSSTSGTGFASNSQVVPQLFAHLGHSRTPSACSAISFASSILSEPISENYPHSEPETDNRGFEISSQASPTSTIPVNTIVSVATAINKLHKHDVANGSYDEDEAPDTSNYNCLLPSKSKMTESLDEIDEGNEADTEDFTENSKSCERVHKRREEAVKEEQGITTGTLPHIDSIHSSIADLSAEILSQHSTKTLDLNAEALSTHSSRTLEGGLGMSRDKAGTRTAEASPERQSLVSVAKVKSLDNDRIESWVAETRQQFEHLNMTNGEDAMHSKSSDGAKVAPKLSGEDACHGELTSSTCSPHLAKKNVIPLGEVSVTSSG